MALLPPHGQLSIKLSARTVGSGGLPTHQFHQSAPFRTVRFRSPIGHVNGVMADLVNHRIPDMPAEIKTKNCGIKTEPAGRTPAAVHARSGASEIKFNWNRRQVKVQTPTRFSYLLSNRLCDQLSLLRAQISDVSPLQTAQSALPMSSTSRSSRFKNFPFAFLGSGSDKNQR